MNIKERQTKKTVPVLYRRKEEQGKGKEKRSIKL
jgi:hypothetical protein